MKSQTEPVHEDSARHPLLILGCGFLGTAAARLALQEGYRVIATVRSQERVAALRAIGVEACAPQVLEQALLRSLMPNGARVLIAFPPDESTDVPVAAALGGASSIVYLSTTSVYGSMHGEVDESTRVDWHDARAHRRLAAEARYMALGATVLRSAGIYGPGRGLHRRVREPSFRLIGDGTSIVSRIHVDDLARFVMRALDSPSAGRMFVVADDTPAPQIDAVRWLCDRLALPMPLFEPAASSDARVAESGIRPSRAADRCVRNGLVKRALGLTLRYPSYREGFEACIQAEARGLT